MDPTSWSSSYRSSSPSDLGPDGPSLLHRRQTRLEGTKRKQCQRADDDADLLRLNFPHYINFFASYHQHFIPCVFIFRSGFLYIFHLYHTTTIKYHFLYLIFIYYQFFIYYS
ncbi:uncharacterized protein LOC100381430 [Zea mays]|uniref:Uncharacterized protein n=1 Tax=Zea mays TaxID=4577 RepID=C0HFY1_MAIZE|nr:uncharacterized protein LOC100381430 [Zea mays]ACN25934.1 unknown [Zea mays]|eukprot:NP_001167742.1 uncharacterized protein LOC100381430 [Zea mays]